MNPLLWWIWQTSAAVLVLTVFVLLASMALKNRPAWRHALWLVVLIKFVTPPIVSWPWSVEEITNRVTVLQTTNEADSGEFLNAQDAGVDGKAANSMRVGPVNSTMPTASLSEDANKIATLSPRQPDEPVAERSVPLSGPEYILSFNRGALTQWLLVGFWCTGSIALVCVQVRRLLRRRAVVVHGGEAPHRLVAETEEVARKLNVRTVPVRVTEEINSPFLWCFGWLTLIWPSALTSDSEIERSRGIIAHELAHLRRRDHLVAWLELAAGVIWWWNPVFWFVRRRLREAAEMACDAISLSICNDRRAYAEMFLELSSSSKTGMPAPALGVSTGIPSSFERRLTMILSERVSGKLSVWGILLIGGLAALTLPNWSLAQSPTDEEQKSVRSRVGNARPGTSRLDESTFPSTDPMTLSVALQPTVAQKADDSLTPAEDAEAQALGEAAHAQLTAVDGLDSFAITTQAYTSYYGNPEEIIGLKDERALKHLKSALEKRDFDRSRSTADLTWAWKSNDVVSTWRQKYLYDNKAYDQSGSRSWDGNEGWFRDSGGSFGRYGNFADTFKHHSFAPSQFLHLGDHDFAWSDPSQYPPFFVGSTIPVSDANYQSLPDEEFAGEACRVIRSIPRQEQFWISKENGRLRGSLTFISQGRFTWMHEMPIVTRMANREFASRDEFQLWFDNELTPKQRLLIRCEFQYLHKDNQRPKDLIEFSDYRQVAAGVEIPMTEWWATWSHADEKYKYNVNHLVVRKAGPVDDLQTMIKTALPQRGDKVTDWRHPVPVSYSWSDQIAEQEILAMVDRALAEQRQNRELVERMMKPLQDMVGKKSPELSHEGWIGESERPTGGKMLLHFWATWCGPCKNDIPLLNRMADSGWTVVGVHAPGTESQEIEAAMQESDIQYPVLLSQEFKGSGIGPDTIAGYPIKMYPVCVLVDKNGTVQEVGQLNEILER